MALDSITLLLIHAIHMCSLTLFLERIVIRKKNIYVERWHLVYFSARDYELVRNQVELGEIIGEGQFGDVHKGTFKGRDNQVIPVAVKTCKADADLATAEKFLEEACKYLWCYSLEMTVDPVWCHSTVLPWRWWQ